MSFQSDRIDKESVIKAARKIERGSLKLHQSTGYDVIIEGKRYPPKEIVRIAYRLATGDNVGTIYGGEQVNKPLRDLGFRVEQKISVWKLGCNWGRGAPSFYDYIRKKKLVIGTDRNKYMKGDLIAITEGFTVYAIAKVKSVPIPITSSRRYEAFCEEYKVDFEEWVTISKVDWYELQKTEIFTYQLQQGIRNIRNRLVIDKIIDLWDNRNKKVFGFTFYSKTKNEPINDQWTFPCFILNSDPWNDFGFETSFDLFFYKAPKERIQIGPLKILQKGSSKTILQTPINSFGEEFCSLGQTIEYYSRLKGELGGQFVKFLRAINDCAFNVAIRRRFENESGFRDSLLRSSEAELVLNDARKLILKQSKLGGYRFTFACRVGNAIEDHKVDFSFNKDRSIPNRFFCLVGKNGTGKTKFISLLANKLTNIHEVGIFDGERPPFSKIIAASFSYFDDFRFPEKEDISYEFIGIKGRKGLQNEEDSFNLVWDAFEKLSNDKLKKALWAKCIKNALEVEYLNFELDELLSISKRTDFRRRSSDIFSSGQKIVFYFVTRLIASIEGNSLLIFDEPETHLHPNIAGRLLRTIDMILKKCRSFCILSTHSPIIVQEMPSKFIRIFDRRDNYPIISNPSIECFGENLSNISNSVFHADQEKEIYKSVFDKMNKNKSIEEIDRIFENRLGLNASLYIQSIKNHK